MPQTEKVKAAPKPDVVDTTAIVTANDARSHGAEPESLPALPVDVQQKALDMFRPSDDGGGALALPRVVLTQSLSRVVTREDDPIPVGVLYNTLTQETYGKELTFVPLLRWPQRLLLTVTQGLQCRSNSLIGPAQMYGGLTVNGETTNDCTQCVKKLWPKTRQQNGEKLDVALLEKGPECAEVENYLALLVNGTDPDDYEPIILSFSKTSLEAGRKLASMHQISRKSLETFKYKVKVTRAAGPNGAVYYRQEIKRLDRNDDPENGGRTSLAEQESAHRWMRELAGQQDTLLTRADEEEQGHVNDAPATSNEF